LNGDINTKAPGLLLAERNTAGPLPIDLPHITISKGLTESSLTK
jgi:hypothetical protein